MSEEKLEPRLGQRADEPGAELEQPLAVARDVASSARRAGASPGPTRRSPPSCCGRPSIATPCAACRSQRSHPYGEVRDNLIAADMRAIDLLRCKLAFFGVTRFDPQSDKWLRITLFQGAPFPDELQRGDWDGWIWGAAGDQPA